MAAASRLKGITLVPALEVPGYIVTPGLETPEHGGDWAGFTRRSFAQAGLEFPAPLPGTYDWFRTQDLQVGPLRRYLDLWFRHHEFRSQTDSLETAPTLDGGYALFEGDRLICLPGCCADLGTIGDWRRLADLRPGDAQMMWNGHPMLLVRVCDGWLELQEEPTEGSGQVLGAVAREELRTAIEHAELERANFESALRFALSGYHSPARAADLAQVLVARR